MDPASHAAVSPGDDGLVRPIERKCAKVAEFRTVLKLLSRGVIEPDASLIVSGSAPTRQDVNILIPIEIEVHGAEPILAARRRFHADPFTAGQVLHGHLGI